MSKLAKHIAFWLVVWILAQAVAWFYGGRQAAEFWAVATGILIIMFAPIAYESL